jgi:hypothetical protein
MDYPLEHINARVRLPLQILVSAVSIALPNALIWLTIAAMPR